MSDDPETLPKPKTPFAKRLTHRQRLEIINLAKEGIPVKRIAEIHGVQQATIYRLLKEKGVKIGLYTEKAAEVAKSEARAELVEQIKQTKDFAFKSNAWIKRRMMTELLNAEKEGKPISVKQDNLKTLKLAMDILRAGTDNDWMVLGLDKENEHADQELPELPIREMSNSEIEAIRDKQILEDLEMGISPDEEIPEDEEDDEDEFAREWGGGHDGKPAK